MSRGRDVVYDNRGRLVRVTDYFEPSPSSRPKPSPRRNAMKSTSPKPSRETRRRLEAVEKDLADVRKFTAQANRRIVESEIAAAVLAGRIRVDESERWFERAEKHGVDVVRDLLRERRPDRHLAAANAAAARPEITDAMKQELASTFGLSPEDL